MCIKDLGEKARKRENDQMCSSRLIGAEAFIPELISFSEASSLTSNPVLIHRETFVFSSYN